MNKFKPGTSVVCVAADAYHTLKEGQVYTVAARPSWAMPEIDDNLVFLEEEPVGGWFEERFELDPEPE